MKQYILDTTACIALIRGNKKVIDTIYERGMVNCFVSEITIAELYYGASKSQRPSQFKDIQMIKETFEIMPILPNLKVFGDVKYELERRGMRIDDFDLLIGVTALNNGMVLVTHNKKHFERIPNLCLEDWE